MQKKIFYFKVFSVRPETKGDRPESFNLFLTIEETRDAGIQDKLFLHQRGYSVTVGKSNFFHYNEGIILVNTQHTTAESLLYPVGALMMGYLMRPDKNKVLLSLKGRIPKDRLTTAPNELVAGLLRGISASQQQEHEKTTDTHTRQKECHLWFEVDQDLVEPLQEAINTWRK